MQPIPTNYKGYRFRSRLEARWAVFFDTLGLKWEYEREGFDLGEGIFYLPDFYLNDYDIYIEIKPEEFESSDDAAAELVKHERFSALGKTLLLITGTPGPDSYTVSPLFQDYRGVFARDRKCDCLVIISDEIGQEGLLNRNCKNPKCGDKQTSEHFGLHGAYDSARAARFEFGDTPNPC